MARKKNYQQFIIKSSLILIIEPIHLKNSQGTVNKNSKYNSNNIQNVHNLTNKSIFYAGVTFF
jgi:hypothetical protein